MNTLNGPDSGSATRTAGYGLQWLGEGGELGRLISAFDWNRTPLGALAQWPQSLRTAVSLMLSSQHPMWIGWGPQATFLYNDAYISVLSRAKHPWALGRPAAEVWAEIWDICGPLADKVFDRGEASFVDDVQLFMNRGDFIEETYYSFSYSPIRDEFGRVGGLFCPSAEVSAKVLNARRLATLSELAANSLVEKTVDRACTSAIRTMGKNVADIPFALVYLQDADAPTMTLAGAAGLLGDDPAVAPARVDSGSPSAWPIREALQGGTVIASVPASKVVPIGLADQDVKNAVVLPIVFRGNQRPVGVLVIGVSPARPLDPDYRTFFELVAGQLATAIQNARAAEEDRRRAEQLAELDRAKTTFFSNISHELRTPLTLMLGPLEEIAQDRRDTAPSSARELAKLAHRNGLRLLKLVNALLDFSRMEAGRMRASFAPTDIGDLTADLASAFRSTIEKAGLQFVVECPPVSEPVYLDRDLWEKIVFNLLSNAFKFTLQGRIMIRTVEEPEAVRLVVSDTGVGIPATAMPRLFERFYRVEGITGRTQEGTGIGLALVAELVRLHGGAIRADSTVGAGTTFTISIPRGRAHLPEDRIVRTPQGDSTALGARPFLEEALRWDGQIEPAPVEPAPPASAERIRGRVLLADDNADMRDYVRRLLSDWFDVIAVPDGVAALEHIRREHPDLVLSDVMMPRLDGFGLLRAIRDDAALRTIPVILLSARAGEEARVDGVGRGADDYLIKPFSARELLARVETHLHLARVRKQAERAMREAEERVRIAMEAAAVGAWSWDLATGRIEWDHRTREIFGAERPPGDNSEGVSQFVHPADRVRVRAELQQALQNRRPYHAEYRIVRADGQVRWVSGHGKLLWSETGEPLRMLGAVLDVTERRQREDLLRDTRARLDATLHAAAVGTWTWDIATNRLLGDASVFRLFSVPEPEQEMAPLDALLPRIHPDDLPRVQKSLTEALEGKRASFEEDYRVMQPDGSCRWIASRGRVRQEPGNQPVMSGVLIDVTERKAAEQERVALLDRLNFSLSALELGDWSWDPQTDVMTCSPRMYDIFGVPEGVTFTREEMRSCLHPDDREPARQAAQRSYVQGVEYTCEYRVIHPTRGLRWVAVKGRPQLDAKRRVIGLLGVAMDITERKQAELHLRRQKEVLEAIVVGTPLPQVLESLTDWVEEFASRKLIATILLVDADGTRLHAAAGSLCPPEWARSLADFEIGPAVGSCGTAAYRRERVIVADIATDPRWISFKDEALRHGLRACWSTPILGTDGSVLGTFAIYYSEVAEPSAHELELVDVVTRTASIAIERQQAEAQLRESRGQLEQHAHTLEKTVADRTAKLQETIGELEAFSYSISHDMRAPLRSMYGYAELLLKDHAGNLDRTAAEYLKRISRNASRLELLVRDVLAYSKVAKEDVVLSTIDLDSFVPWLVAQMSELQRPDITINVLRPLPTVKAHEAYLSQILSNLIGNAVKFRAPGVAPIITIGSSTTAGWATISISDNGIGIEADQFSRIFEIFGRVHPDKKFEGTGIGLSIVKKAVQRLGGTVGVESVPGQGSTFWFTLQLS